MKKRVLMLCALFFPSCLWAKESVDESIKKAAADIAERCSANSVIAIDDFESPSPKMTLYIRERLADGIFEQSPSARIVTRERMDKVEKELRFQNSGVVSEKTIVSVAERLGARFVVFGWLEEFKSGYVLVVRTLDVKTGSYVFRKSYEFQYNQKTEQLLGRAPSFKKFAAGAIFGLNKNSIQSVAPAFGLCFDYSFHRKFSVGAKIIASVDIGEKENKVFSLETLAIARYYLASFSGEPATGFFAEAQVGAMFLFVNSKPRHALSAGACAGYRFAINSFYVEPQLRFGYPYICGFGIAAGMRF